MRVVSPSLKQLGVAYVVLATVALAIATSAAERTRDEHTSRKTSEVFDTSKPTTDKTPDELLSGGQHAFAAGKWAEAETAFASFIQDYGNSPQAKAAMESVLRFLGYAQLQQKKYDTARETMQRYLREYPQGTAGEDFTFWAAISLFKAKEYAAAGQALRDFVQKFPRSDMRQDAEFTSGACLLAEEKYEDAGNYFAQLAKTSPALYGRAKTFEFFCLVKLGKKDEALVLAKELAPRSGELESIALFHFLALQLGNELLEAEQFRPALTALQCVWPKGRIVERQQERLTKMQAELAAAEAKGNMAAVNAKTDAVARLQAELANIDKIPDYDTALQMRMAQCFYKLERFREAALILNRMVQKLPDSELLTQSNYMLLTCYVEMKRWPAAVEAAQKFAEKYPQSKLAPTAMYLAGEAMQRMNDWPGAAEMYAATLKRYPDAPMADRILFLRGYALLMLDKNDNAIAVFDEYKKKHPQGSLHEAAYYWTGMAHSFAQRHPEAREAMGVYLQKYPKGSYQTEAEFRRAHALYGQKNWEEACKELEAFAKTHAGHPRAAEAWLLLGDSRFAIADIEGGIDAYGKVTPETPQIYDLAYFKVGKGYKQLEQVDQHRKHFTEFVEKHGDSNRVVEALYEIAWADRQKGNLDAARKMYWETARKYGNDARKPGVEDLFSGLLRLYKTDDEKARFLAELRDYVEEAQNAGKMTMAARGLWAQAQVVKRQEPDRARALLVQGASLIKPEEGSSVIIPDFADALRENNQSVEAKAFYEGLIKWYPRAFQKDRSYAGLGLIAVKEGHEKEALDQFAKFEKESIQSPLRPSVLSAKADLLLQRRDYEGAIAQLEEILKIKAAKGKPWVIALNKIGNSYMALGKPDKAVPYFQRIYIMYGAYPDHVAEAYWQSAQAFEKLNMKQEALKTYKEILGRDDLKPFKAYLQAKERLQQIGDAT